MDRLHVIKGQVSNNNVASEESLLEKRPKNKADWFKESGWGYKDTEFTFNKDGQVLLTGSRYLFSGHVLPNLRAWCEKNIGFDINVQTPPQAEMPIDPPVLNQAFLDAIKGHAEEITTDKRHRIMHSHGHSMQELYEIRHTKMPRTVDVVVYVNNHDQVEKIVPLACQHNVCIIPYGGGTNVTHALLPPKEEQRMIVSLDVTRMNHVKWVDRKNMKACVEAGIIGRDLEVELARYNLCLGHEPDSVEFSSLGGWVSTRASGMKKNTYGNIEDIVMQTKIVTPMGTLVKGTDSPRLSSGPDIEEIILGSEGTLGVITEVIVKVRELPEVREFASLILPNFETGIKFMHDVAKSRLWPASLRLVDNTQFQFALALKPMETSLWKEATDKAKKFYLEHIRNFDLSQIAVVTIVYEHTRLTVEAQKKSIDYLTKKYNGIPAGKEAGERGYFLTFMIAYLRDFGFNFSFIAESFETSAAWSQIPTMISKTQDRIVAECKKHGIKKAPWISSRVTQVYDTGAAVYIYFGFLYDGIKNPDQVYSEIEDAAREEIMKHGGTISHHHGVGKLRKQFLKQSIGDVGVKVIKGIKNTFDPNNIFGSQNLIDLK